MVPSALVVLPELPLTPSGKVDRKALPAPELRTASRRSRMRAAHAAGALAGRPLARGRSGSRPIGVHDDFFALGGNSITGAVLINRLQQELGEIVHVVAIFDHPTVARLAAYLAARARRGAVRRGSGIEVAGETSASEAGRSSRPGRRCGAPGAAVAPPCTSRGRCRTRSPGCRRTRRALFVLSPPRSGSTLLRVMLGGHPRLFAPPELELLEFDTLAERRDAFSGRDAFRLEGAAPRRDGGPPAAAPTRRGGVVDELEARGGHDARALRPPPGVDRRPHAGRQDADLRLDLATLRRAEAGFEGAALRPPACATPTPRSHSFEEARIEQVFFPRAAALQPPRARRADLAAGARATSCEFLAGVPAERRHVVRFEELVARARAGAARRSARSSASTTTPTWPSPTRTARRG